MELIKDNAQANPETEQPSVPQVNDVAPPAAAPANDANVAPAPAATEDKAAPESEPAKDEAPLPKPVKPPKPPKSRGTGAAIFAAVVIVLALGAMFTYAYLKTQ
jgi:hypothetical protein